MTQPNPQPPIQPPTSKSLGGRGLCFAALALAFVGGCGVPDIEGQMTISQGVYGQTLGGCDTPGCSTRVYSGLEVTLFSDAAMTSVVGTSTSSGSGFYEIAAPAGHYWLKGRSVAGREIDIPSGLVRWDFESGPGGGIWREP